MTDHTINVHSLDLAALSDISPAAHLIDTHSLDQAEQLIAEVTGISELHYETAKATQQSTRTARPIAAADLPRVDQLAAEAARRDADFISMRRLAELLGATSLDTYADLTRLLAEQRPSHFAVGRSVPSAPARPTARSHDRL